MTGNNANEPVNYLNCSRGLWSWLFTLDHKRIGVMYLIAILVFFFVGGIFAMLIRMELMDPGTQYIDKNQYNQVFTLHGAIMIFLVIIPGIPAAIGNFVLPIMLGAKDVAFPKLNLLSFWLYSIGAIFFIITLLTGGLDTGWTFYTPYSTTTTTNVIMAVLGAFVLGFSSIFTGLNFIVTVYWMRPKGMGWFNMPLFLWAIYATAIIQVLATPVLGITLLLLIAERVLKVGIFDPAMGGNPVLFQHFFWFYSHPAVYIMILPAMGVISEVVSVFSRKHIFGYRFIAYSSIAIAVIGFLVWGHHMFTSGQSDLANMIFSVLTMLVAIPSAIKVFNWVATMYKGAIVLSTPFIYVLMFIFMFGIGGLTGIFQATLPVDVHLHDTYFIVAHFHYTMMGSGLVGLIAAVHYWWPKMFGRMYSEVAAKITAAIVFIGFNLTFIPQFVMGTQGMPRRYQDYIPQYHSYHHLSSIGGMVLMTGFIIMTVYLIVSLYKGRRAPANPWGGNTMEWKCASPPPPFNFDTPPYAGDPYDFSNLEYDAAIGGYVEKPA